MDKSWAPLQYGAVWLVLECKLDEKEKHNTAGQPDMINVESYWPTEQDAKNRVMYLAIMMRQEGI